MEIPTPSPLGRQTPPPLPVPATPPPRTPHPTHHLQKTNDQPWPWSSLDYAILLNAIGPFSPSVVALDLPLSEGDALYPIYDIQLANQMARFNSIVLSQYGSNTLPGVASAIFSQAAHIAPAGLSARTSTPNSHLPIVFFQEDRWLPSFALQIAADHLGADWKFSQIQPGRQVLLRDAKGRLLLEIPINPQGQILRNSRIFSSPVQPTDFYSAIISAEDLRNGGSGLESFHEIRRNIILVGSEAPNTYQPLLTSSGPRPPIHLHYHLLQQLLSGSTPRELGHTFYLLFLICACLMAGAFALIPSRLGSLSLLLLYLGACAIGSYLSFDLAHTWWPPLPIMIGLLLSWLTARCLNILTRLEDREQPELFQDL
ncbi:MAG: CHASE2 domain-containing protein [Blastochloris sp.]|nr:CHASE2 domain-containing protein [Blastochloris sp.]